MSARIAGDGDLEIVGKEGGEGGRTVIGTGATTGVRNGRYGMNRRDDDPDGPAMDSTTSRAVCGDA